ncbi:Platinum sensitivity protein [Microbotryomycetes sp. JL201]|nr:Platinum sensitivity protein [Microbotryomycetes sp. JL201]
MSGARQSAPSASTSATATTPQKRARSSSPPLTDVNGKRKSPLAHAATAGRTQSPRSGTRAAATTTPPRTAQAHAERSHAPSPQPVASTSSSAGTETVAADAAQASNAGPSSSPPPSSSSSTVVADGSSSPSGSPQHSQRRVKVYRLQDDKWIDLGTGHCAIEIKDPSSNEPSEAGLEDGAHIIVKKEASKDGQGGGEIILRTKVTPAPPGYTSDDEEEVIEGTSGSGENGAAADGAAGKTIDIGGYQRQQDTLIVWTEADTEHEMALSFATSTGCGEIWEFIKAARRWLHNTHERSASPSPTLSSPQPFPHHHHPATPMPTRIPKPELSNIPQVEETIRAMSRTAVGRERTANMIVRTQLIQELFEIHQQAEDLEDLDTLHALCRLMQTILLLNDNVIFELILRDDVILGVVGILEYDPEFPTMKAAYREHLADPSHFTEVVPIRNKILVNKIHQTHRLHYLKDVVLARVIEDSTFSMLNSAIYFNEVDIVQEIGSDNDFITELFALFDDSTASDDKGKQKAGEASNIGPQLPPELAADDKSQAPTQTTEERQANAILFLQQFVLMAKNLQLQARAGFYRSLVDRGLLKVIEVALTSSSMENNPTSKSATFSIFIALVDHDSNNVRAYSLRQKNAGQRTLIELVINLFHDEQDLGLKAQMSEALRVLVDAVGDGVPFEVPPRIRQEDPEAEKFLQYFYDDCVAHLFKPLLDLPEPTAEHPLALSTTKVALCGHLCDLLCFFINHHSFRSKYFFLSTNVASSTAKLFSAKQKPLRLGAMRVLRATVNKNDDFFNRFLIKNDLFRHILQVAEHEREKDNLLRSAALEFFEYIRMTNAKAVINHVMDRYEKRVRDLATSLKTFDNLVIKWEQNNAPPPPSKESAGSAVSADMSRERSTSWSRMVEEAEEKYFNEDDEDDMTASTSASVDMLSTHVDTPRKRPSSDDVLRKRSAAQGDESAAETGSPSGGGASKRAKLEKTKSLTDLLENLERLSSSSTKVTGKKPLVDYFDEEEDDDENVKPSEGGGFIRESELASTSKPVANEAGEPRLLASPPPLPPLRKKAEHDDEDDGTLGLLKSKGLKNDPKKPTTTTSDDSKEKAGSAVAGGIKISLGGFRSSLAKLGQSAGKESKE